MKAPEGSRTRGPRGGWLLRMQGEDDQVVAGAVEVADAGFQGAASVQVELAGWLEFRFPCGFDDQQLAPQPADLVLDPAQELFADPLTLELLPGPDPVQVEGGRRQRAATVGGEASDLLAGARHQEMVPALRPLGGKLCPEFPDGFDVLGIEQRNAAR